MQLPLNQLYPPEDEPKRVTILPSRRASSIVPAEQRIRYIYTSGTDIVGFNTRASVTDYLLRRAISNVGSFDDLTLADAFPASPTALACTNYTANKVANLPLRALNMRREALDVSPLDSFIMSAPQVLRQAAFSLRIWGRVYLRKRRNPAGIATMLEWVNPALVMEIQGRDGYVESYQITDPVSRAVETVPVRDVVYAQDFDSRPEGVGLSYYEASWRYVNVQIGLVTFQAAYFVNNARPDGIISFEQDPEEEVLDRVQEEFARQHKGMDNAHRTTILPGGATYTPIQSDPNKTAATETDERTVKHICAIFGVNPALIGMDAARDPLGANTTFNSLEVAFVRDVAKPLVTQVLLPALNAQWASRDFLDPYILEVNDSRIPEFTESNLSRTDTANAQVAGNLATFNEARELIGMEPDDEYPLKRMPGPLLDMWTGASATLDLLLQGVGVLPPGKTLGKGNGNILNWNGIAVPLDRLRELADANVDRIVAEAKLMAASALSPFGDAPAIPQEQTPPQLPQGEPVEPEARAEDLPDTSLCIALDLSNHPDLIAMQRAVKQYCQRQGIEADWNAPDSFHVTLAYAADATDEQVAQLSARLSALPIPALSLRVGSLSAFESVGGYPLHLRVRRNDDLLALQRACYDAMRACGLELSAYSEPDAYKPHITMGYADSKVSWTYKGDLRVRPGQLVVWHGEGDAVYEKACGADPERTESEPQPVTRSQRTPIPTTLALRFGLDDDAPNVHLAQACRSLDEALRAADVPNPTWIPRELYRLDLCDLSNAAPSVVSKFVRALDLQDQRVIDLWTAGFALSDRTVYLTFEPCAELDALRAALALEADGAGIDAAVPAWVGIALCELQEAIDPDVLPQSCARLPLVGVALSLYRNNEARHTWTLAGRSEAQAQELRAYAKRMARNAEKPFVFEALMDHPAALWLDDARAADVALDDALEVARAILAGEDVHVLRAYPQTRVGFVQAVAALFTDTMDGKLSRAKFGAQMRSILRRWGLMAFRDGLTEAGYPENEGLDANAVAAFRAWQEQSSKFVTGLGDEFYKERKILDDDGRVLTGVQIIQRAEMWANISLESAREAGIRAANPKQRARWRWDPQAEHCDDCRRLNGKVYTIEEWYSSGVTPGSGKTQCKSGCKCTFELVDNKTRLSPLRLIGLSGTRRALYDGFDEEEEADDGAPVIGHICDATDEHEHGPECGCGTLLSEFAESLEQVARGETRPVEDLWTELEQMADGPQVRAVLDEIREEERADESPNGDTEDDDAYDADEQRAVPEKYSHIDWKPTEAMADNARRALEVRAEKPDSQKGMTAVGIARARDISNRKNLSPETVRRMKAYFDRHEVDKQGETWDEQGKGWQAWNGWGGDEGYAWSRKRVEQMNAADEKADA